MPNKNRFNHSFAEVGQADFRRCMMLRIIFILLSALNFLNKVSHMKRLLAGSFMVIIISCSVVCVGSEKQTSEFKPQKSHDQTGKTKRITKKVGPFEIVGKRVVVILDITEHEGQPYLYHSFEIKDETGESYYRELLESDPESYLTIEGIFKLEGKSGQGLILFYNEQGAPPAGKSFQIFGIKKGVLKPLSPRINVYGRIEQLPEGRSKDVLNLLNGDLLNIKVWKGLIGVVIPLVVDFKKQTIIPLINEGVVEIYFSITPDQPHIAFGIPVKLYEDHNVNANRKTIAAKEVKKVVFLNAYANVQFENQSGGHTLDIDVSNLWLKVKIDGIEGWVNDQEDFFTLGLIPLS